MEEIKSALELKQLVYPALISKLDELKRNGYKLITIDDVWEILIDRVWLNKSNIALCDIVNDILNYNNEELYNIFLDRLEKNK